MPAIPLLLPRHLFCLSCLYRVHNRSFSLACYAMTLTGLIDVRGQCGEAKENTHTRNMSALSKRWTIAYVFPIIPYLHPMACRAKACVLLWGKEQQDERRRWQPPQFFFKKFARVAQMARERGERFLFLPPSSYPFPSSTSSRLCVFVLSFFSCLLPPSHLQHVKE